MTGSQRRRNVPLARGMLAGFLMYCAWMALAVFVGTGSAVLLVAVSHICLGLWVTSRARWNGLMQILGIRAANHSRQWAPAYPLLLVLSGLLWLAFAVLFFLFANLRFIDIVA